VLLNLWATWCVPCRKEMPSLDRLQAQLGGPAFEVVALSIDKSPQAVREFYREYGIRKLALYIDPSAEVTSTLGAVGIPTTLLVDGDGRERVAAGWGQRNGTRPRKSRGSANRSRPAPDPVAASCLTNHDPP